MFKLLNEFIQLLGPEESGKGSAVVDPANESLTQREVFNLLGDEEEDEKEEPLDLKEEKEDKVKEDEESTEESDEKDEKEDKEDKEDELALEDDDDTSDEETELIAPVPWREIREKYPKLDKEFPYLKSAYYRDQQFTELFATPADAKEVIEKSGTLDTIEQDLLSGNIGNLLNSLKQVNQNAFYQVADNYLLTLSEVDQKAYDHVVSSIIKDTVVHMYKDENEETKKAAEILYKFVFNSNKFQPMQPLSKRVESREDDGLKREREEFNRDRFNIARNELATKVNNVLRATIEGHIDPKGTMTDYVKRNAIRDAMNEVIATIDKDKSFRTVLDKLWERSVKSRFDEGSKKAIKSAYLSKAKTLLPAVIKKARNEAMKGLGKKVRETDDEGNPSPQKKGPAAVGRTASSQISGKNDRERAKSIPKGMSTKEFLMSD